MLPAQPLQLGREEMCLLGLLRDVYGCQKIPKEPKTCNSFLPFYAPKETIL